MSVSAEAGVSIPQFLSLYLDLEEGEHADLVVVARASLALAEIVKETAYIIDPSLEVALEFKSGTDSSLSLNTLIKSAKSKLYPRPISLSAIALAVICALVSDSRTFGVVTILDHFLTPEQRHSLSDDDIARLVQALENARDGKIAKAPIQQLYREIERDTAIKGLGATTIPGTRPPDIIPRAQFQQRSGAEIEEKKPEIRTRTTTERLTLVSPVLLPTDRTWRFYLPSIGEFGAKIKDEKFRASILSGRRHIAMRAGIQLDVELDTREEKIGNVWVVKDRSIKRVIKPRRIPSTPDLFSSEKKKRNEG
jgi:hypothetical protein